MVRDINLGKFLGVYNVETGVSWRIIPCIQNGMDICGSEAKNKKL